MTAADERAALVAPLPEDARMEAYHYDFHRTGVGAVDAVLSAVAIAGKGNHHTEWWNEENPDFYNGRDRLVDGDGTAVGLIQANAQRLADLLEADGKRLALADAAPHHEDCDWWEVEEETHGDCTCWRAAYDAAKEDL